ncbi:MAG: DUF1573 domain-containing protein [Planctomycetaceae bacterium]
MPMSYRVMLLSVFSVCCCAPAVGYAQTQVAQDIARNGNETLSWAQKMFEHQKIDFGTIAKGSDARFQLKLKNLYKEDVHISNVKTTCGCSAATPAKTTLVSLEATTIEITMDTQRFSHRKDSNVIVTFDAPFPAEVRIPITSYIRTDVVVTPGAANFGPVEKGLGGEKILDLAYAGRDDWAITEVINRNEFITAKVIEVGRGQGKANYKLHFTISPDAPIGLLRSQVTIVTNDANGQTVPILVEAKVESDITVTPDNVSLGLLVPGQTKKVNVVLRSKKPFAIEKIVCDSNREAFQVQLPNPEKELKAIYILPLTLTTPNDPGDFQEGFEVTVVGRSEPVKFKAVGKIVEKSN